jgi:hypothetical protein
MRSRLGCVIIARMTTLEDLLPDDAELAAENTIEAMAHHEAGHVVVAHAFGRPIAGAAINLGKLRGSADIGELGVCPHEDMLIAMAGVAAQCKALGRSPEWLAAGYEDLSHADDFAEACNGDVCDFMPLIALLDRDDIWRRVVAIAEALVRRQSLSAEELQTLLME